MSLTTIVCHCNRCHCKRGSLLSQKLERGYGHHCTLLLLAQLHPDTPRFVKLCARTAGFFEQLRDVRAFFVQLPEKLTPRNENCNRVFSEGREGWTWERERDGRWVGGMARMGKWISGMWGERERDLPPRQTEVFHFHQLWKVPYCLKQRVVDLKSIFVSQKKTSPLPLVPN